MLFGAQFAPLRPSAHDRSIHPSLSPPSHHISAYFSIQSDPSPSLPPDHIPSRPSTPPIDTSISPASNNPQSLPTRSSAPRRSRLFFSISMLSTRLKRSPRAKTTPNKPISSAQLRTRSKLQTPTRRRGRRHFATTPSQPQQPIKIKDLTEQLRKINSSQPEREVWWIIQAKSGVTEKILRLAANHSQPNIPEPEIDISALLTPVQLAAVNTALDERIQLRRPLQYVLGDVDFCKLTLRTQEGILIPRPETEQMTAWLVHQIKLYNQYVVYEKETKLVHELAAKQPQQPGSDGQDQDTIRHLQDNNAITSLISTKQLFDFTEDSVGLFHGKYPLHQYKFSWFDAIVDPLVMTQRRFEEKQQTFSNFCSPSDTRCRLDKLRRELEEVRLLDLCSGSGNISLAFARQFPHGKSIGVDIDPNALQLARFNKRTLDLGNVKFYHCDLFRNSISQTVDPTAPSPHAIPDKIDPDDLSSGRTATSRVAEVRKFEDPTMDPKQNPDFLFTTKTLTFDEQRKIPVAAIEDANVAQKEQFLGLYDLPILSSLADIIVSNPPYVLPEDLANLEPEVKAWENHFALAPFESIYNSSELGIPYAVDATLLAQRGLKPEDLPPWPSKEQIRQHALPFYERIIKNSTRLLTHNEHYIPRQGIKFPRLVLEIGHEAQALHVANMASYIFDVEVYSDAFDRPRWIVGYEPPGYH